jgi:tetratricopeptide (TPR) repeat protein
MRRLAILVALVAAARADARPGRFRSDPPPELQRDFWRSVIEPHATEVHRILYKVRSALQQTENANNGDYDPTGEQRARFDREVYGMLRYAHKLSPDNLDVLRLLGQTADELGKTRAALDALESAVRLYGPEAAGVDVTGRLGAIYLRLGRVEDAIRMLRAAQAPVTPGVPASAVTLVHLSNALAARGDMSAAIDVLANSVPASVPFYSNELALVAFALAVQYDRDDERGAAFDVLDRMVGALQAPQFAAQVQGGFALMRWAPPEDQHYYQALLYEAMGTYVEARTEWALYAASGDLPYRARALQHIAAIDAERPVVAPATAPQIHLIRRPHRMPTP